LFEDRKYALAAGDVFVITPNEVHGYDDIEGLDLCNIMFDFKRFDISDSDLQHLPGFHALFHLEPAFRLERGLTSKFRLSKEQMLHLFHNLVAPLEEEYRDRPPACESMMHAYLTLVIGYLSRNYVEQATPASPELLGLSRVRSFIESNYQDDISLQDLADIACMSKNTLLRAFTKYYGGSPIKYLIHYRLTKASDLLREGNSSVTDVAYAVGFSDSSYFARQFQKAYRLTPREFRKRAT
jgi:AraC-like DNA-binding protein